VSNYTKSTNFSAKDTLPLNDPAKIIKGTEFDAEFNAIVTAISSKSDSASPVFTGTPVAPTASPGTNTTQIATTAFVTAADTAAITAERSATATLTNKTLTTPVLTTPKVDVINENTSAAGVTVDGVLLKDGNVTGSLTGNVTGNVTGDVTGTASNSIGEGQTWQDVTASRALATNYTNSTNKPIMVAVSMVPANNVSTKLRAIIDGVTIGLGDYALNASTAPGGSFIVPAGSVYQVTASGRTVDIWAELR
jgi:hypothetical protein